MILTENNARNLKASDYLIFSEPVVNGKYRLAYSTISTELVVIRSQIYQQIIDNEIDSIDDNVAQQLFASKMLVPHNFNELRQVISENKDVIAKSGELYQVVQPSANCQLGCNYCGQAHTKATLDDRLRSEILERVGNNLRKRSYRSLKIGWFGGEPIMGYESIKKLSVSFMNMAKEANCTYSAKMVTNGLSLKNSVFYDLAINYRVKSFEITLDGTGEHHDLRRHTKLGEKTFDIIFDNIKSIVLDPRFDTVDAAIRIRCNVDRSNYTSAFELVDQLHRENIMGKVHFYTAPIHSWGNDAHKSSLTYEEYAEFQIELATKLMTMGYYSTFLPKKRKYIVCLSVEDDGELFDAYGNVYNCTEVSQVPTYEEKGTYRIDHLLNHNLKMADDTVKPFSSWNNDILNDQVPCHSCKILPICGGACPKLWYEGLSPCPDIKHNIKNRMVLQFYRHLDKILTSIR